MTQPHLDGLPPQRPATLADLAALPSTHTGHILGGKLYAFPRPRNPHTKATSRLGVRLGPFDPDASGPGGYGGWLFLDESELHLAGDVLVPDLAGWQREGLDLARLDPYPTVPPAWVCEVLSPRTETFDRGAKAESYAAHGVGWLWFVDPEAKTLEVYANDAGTWRQRLARKGNVEVTAPPFDALAWPLASLWA
jgi:Uma2 family endonuclease